MKTSPGRLEMRSKAANTKPVSTTYLPRPTHQEVGTSTDLDIRTTGSSSKRPTNVTYYIGGKA